MSIADWLFGSKCAGCSQRTREEKRNHRSGSSSSLFCPRCYDRLPEVQKRKEEEIKHRKEEERARAFKLWLVKLNDLGTPTLAKMHIHVNDPLWSVKQVAALCVQLELDGYKLHKCTAESIEWSTNRSGYRPYNTYYEIYYQKPDAYFVNGHSYGTDEGSDKFGPKVPAWLEQISGQC